MTISRNKLAPPSADRCATRRLPQSETHEMDACSVAVASVIRGRIQHAAWQLMLYSVLLFSRLKQTRSIVNVGLKKSGKEREPSGGWELIRTMS